MLKVFWFLYGLGAVVIGLFGFLSYYGYGVLLKANPNASAIQVSQLANMSTADSLLCVVILLTLLVMLKACEMMFAASDREVDKEMEATNELK